MATYFGTIDSYFVNILSPRPFNGKRLISISGSFGAATLWFLPEDSSLPDNRKRPNQDIFEVYYHMDSWTALIDILRNESPLYFHFNDTSNAAQLHTSHEPVGEEESGS